MVRIEVSTVPQTTERIANMENMIIDVLYALLLLRLLLLLPLESK